MKLNKRDQAIVDWVKKNRRDLDFNVHIAPAFRNEGISGLMAIAFAAGREFQAKSATPTISNDPHDYA